ncbi:hypothetical protein OH76DRAFT_1484382 [Lentinus brumalis]|uniref:Uncharacterized protein n=1 Tax=Lentinus brumalis TaxID=2498619 RepID=A0A371D5Y0_9APHY|nr:hypothetical protein OH76DRAFT_1484382 [Polyporus brumalis]
MDSPCTTTPREGSLPSVPPSTRSPSPAGDESGPSAEPPTLKKTRTGTPKLGSVETSHGIVAGPGFSETSTFTTPNAEYVPKFAVAHSEITTFADGRWGYHEYSRWPQKFSPDAFYLACIPRHPGQGLGTPSPILWDTFKASNWQAVKCGVPGFGKLDLSLAWQLQSAMNGAFGTYRLLNNVPPEDKRIASFLMLCIRHAVDRLLNIPAPSGATISVAGHVQRLILELWGLIKWLQNVRDVLKDSADYRTRPWDVLGAHTSSISEAERLHWAGIPVWFQQKITYDLVVYEVVEPRTLPDDFSQVPSYPRLVLAKRDLSGALNMPGEWRRAMDAVVRRQLFISKLPAMLQEDADNGPPMKRLREGAYFVHEGSSELGGPAPVFFLQGDREAKTVGHGLPAQPVASSSAQTSAPTQLSRRARARKKARNLAAAEGLQLPPPTPQALNPSRQWYAFEHVQEYPSWSRSLAQASPLPQPPTSVRYYFAPPWLLDTLQGYPPSEKTARYIHQWISIQTFCVMRLFDQTIDGRPLTIAEWRDALWGDYDINQTRSGPPARAASREALRLSLRDNIRRLFGKVNTLPSYHADVRAELGETVVTSDMAAKDMDIRKRVLWEVCETNWRCELLALDALMLGSDDMSQLDRWFREAAVSRVWGPGTSGMDVVPPPPDARIDCWKEPEDPDWETCRRYLSAFIEVLGRWEGFPPTLQGGEFKVKTCGPEEYMQLYRGAVDFYVSCFVSRFGRLPVVPVRPHPLGAARATPRNDDCIMS